MKWEGKVSAYTFSKDTCCAVSFKPVHLCWHWLGHSIMANTGLVWRWGKLDIKTSPSPQHNLDINQLCLPTHDVFESGWFEWMPATPCTTQSFSHSVITLLVTQTAFYRQSLAWGSWPNKCKITHGLCPLGAQPKTSEWTHSFTISIV